MGCISIYSGTEIEREIKSFLSYLKQNGIRCIIERVHYRIIGTPQPEDQRKYFLDFDRHGALLQNPLGGDGIVDANILPSIDVSAHYELSAAVLQLPLRTLVAIQGTTKSIIPHKQFNSEHSRVIEDAAKHIGYDFPSELYFNFTHFR